MKKFITLLSPIFLLSVPGFLFLSSCTSEEPDPEPPLPSYYGTPIRSDIENFIFMTWSEKTAELIVATESGLSIIDPVTKTSREVSAVKGTGVAGMVLDSTLYLVDSYGTLSALNLSTMTFKHAIVDSVSTESGRMAINSKHFAYAKFLSDSYMMYLYDFATATERKLLMEGMPCQFSPDGSKLLFIRDDKFYTYDLQTQAVEFVTELFAPTLFTPIKTLRWRPEGIVSYAQSNNGFEVTNESTKHVMAQWPAWGGPIYISQSGTKMMVIEPRCANQATANCTPFQYFGSVLDITTGIKKKDLIYGPALILTDVTFIQNETAVVCLKWKSLYLVDMED